MIDDIEPEETEYRGRTSGQASQTGAPVPAVPPKLAARQLKLFALRCLELADRVAASEMAFLDAVDVAYGAAVWSGLVESVGDDIVQATIAAAFANARRP